MSYTAIYKTFVWHILIAPYNQDYFFGMDVYNWAV